ncbi:MAG TPA: cyanophycin synthetase, partial [Solirubrobacterales bacterium]|nr:cyanophycin synthetase [Solirubrobacterales bacterium]
HEERWAERIRIGGAEISSPDFGAAVERVAQAVAAVARTLDPGDAVTQFEAATAASFVALARARVEVAVVEAGLGGRLDATNVLPSRVTVLTSIGLDHTEWLGETELEIAAETLAVLRDQTTLVLGEVSAEVAELAERTAKERGARIVQAPADPGPEVRLRAPGEYQRRNFAVACAAAEAFLSRLDAEAVAQVAESVTVPGRLEPIAAHPPTYLDAAHNPAGAAALAGSLPEVAAGRRVVACLAILADKVAGEMVAALAPVLDRVVCTELPAAALEGHGRPGARSRPAAELAAICIEAGLDAETEPSFDTALRRGGELAAVEPEGLLLVAGSHYAIGPARGLLGA